MSDLETLSGGRKFEHKVLGVYSEASQELPQYFDFRESLDRVVNLNWNNYARSLRGEVEWHNPTNPTMGITAYLWKSVDQHLSMLDTQHGRVPLNLYISVGWNSLDFYHGVDAVFYWHGVFVTIDLSLVNKLEREGGLKADVLFTPKDLEYSNLELFGEHVASLLHLRLSEERVKNVAKRRAALHHLSDYL